MALKVPYLADAKLESAATELLRKYAKWKGTPPRPPIPIDDIVEGLLGLSLSPPYSRPPSERRNGPW